MRRYLLLLIFVLSFCFTTDAEARKLALLIGVDDYDSVQPLSCCVNDMNTIKTALMKIGFEENDIQMLVTGGAYRNYPTKKKIEQKLADLLSSANSSDLVFIAFSGHGAQNGKMVYFCPVDTDTEDLDGTCVSITKVMDDIAKCPAKFKWMVVDACRNDPASSRDAKGLQIVPSPPAGIALFQSCADGEKSYEERGGGNGYFTKNFAAALSGEADSNQEGLLTLMEVCTWTTAHTKAEVLKSEQKTQRPYFSGSITDFTLMENLNVPKAKALAEEARQAMREEKYALAIEKFDAALKLCPSFESWKNERDSAQRLLNVKPVVVKPAFNPKLITVPNDIPTIEEAYRNVEDGGIITIQPGRYELSSTLEVNRPVTFRGNSGRPEDVAIDCPYSDAFKISYGSPSFQNLTASSGAEKCGGFDITGGTPKLFRCIVTSRKAVGMYVHGERANPQVESSVFKNCGQNGVFVYNKALGAFNDCEIYGNGMAGIEVTESANPTVTGCKIYDGKAVGANVHDSGLGKFSDCDFYGNADGGIDVKKSGNPTVTRCKIHDEKSSGVFVTQNGLGTFNDCEIYGNKLSGIEVKESGNPTFTGCKIHDGKSNGVFVYESGLGKFDKCEIYQNENAGISVCESGNPTVTGCKIYDGKQSGVYVHNSGLGTFDNCEIYRNEFAGIEVIESGNPTVTGCKIHDGKQSGVYVYDRGKGTFNNNVLQRNFTTGQTQNWDIESSAGTVSGSGNSPAIPRISRYYYYYN